MPTNGYTSSTSVRPGDTLDLYLSTDPPGPITLSVVRYGSDSPTPLRLQLSVEGQPVPDPPERPWETGFNWRKSSTPLTIPTHWPSGLYLLQDPQGDNITSFVVRAETPGATSRILLQVCYNTLQAYNDAGGKSLYNYNSYFEGRRADKVSFLRPNGVPEKKYELAFIDWLRRENIPVEYCSSVDLHTGAVPLSAYNLLLVVGHSEYWSREMRDNVDAFVSNGGNLAVFSGNTCYRQVRFEQGTQVMVFYKQPQNDPLTNVDNSRVTVAFSHPPVSRPPNQTIGLGMDSGGGSWGKDDLDAAYTLHTPGHWAFAGVSGTTLGGLGTGLVGYETDAAATVEYAGFPCVTGEDGTPRTFTVLASADLRDRWFEDGKPGRATLGLFVRNGTVFNVGTTGWAAATLGKDTNVSRVTANVIKRLCTRNTWSEWERIGHANNVTAMTSLDGKLFAATSGLTLWARAPAGADIAWYMIGQAPLFRALAATEGRLYALDTYGVLWTRPPVESDVAWTHVEQLNTVKGIQAFTATGGMLYALDADGFLFGCPAGRTQVVWRPVSLFKDATPIRCMTGHRDTLYAATEDHRLVRTNMDFVFEATAWTPLHDCNDCTGLAVVEDMLFATATDNRLRWMDLLHFKAR
jgi:hypothetical protein